jgi:ATP-dependent DNA ligase
VRAFADLLDALVYAPQRNAKLRLLEDFFHTQPDPERGYALAALTGGLSFNHAKPALIRGLVAECVDPTLFALSYDYVGDLAETAALIWPAPADAGAPPALTEVVERLSAAGRSEVAALIVGWLDALDAGGRYALLKLITGALRVGVSARLAKQALANFGGRDVGAIEEIWHGLAPPYAELFAWLEGTSAVPPTVAATATFRPLMLANPLDEDDLPRLDPGDFAAEWKWDGIRVQMVGAEGARALFSRTGDAIGTAFPDVLEAIGFDAVLDGELLVVRDGHVAPFNDLQQRLGRKAPTKDLLARYPAHVRVYDLLSEGGEDLRTLPFAERRQRLDLWIDRHRPPLLDLSPLVPFAAWDDLAAIRARAREDGSEGLMLKRRDSVYVAGRPKGPWFKWKREPLVADCVLMYAQRGHGKRSSFYSDYTFGCWRHVDGAGAAELVPVGKAYFGFTDAELIELDRWVRANTTDRFGPVRAVSPGLVLEIAFDAVQSSSRHKSGLAMRFPRVQRIRWDKPAAAADTLATLQALIITS